jgi:hypothetical protein
MSTTRIHGSDVRHLGALLAAVLEDPDLVSELSVIEKEHLEGAREALHGLLPVVEARDLEDTVNES